MAEINQFRCTGIHQYLSGHFLLNIFQENIFGTEVPWEKKKQGWTCKFNFYDCYMCLVQSTLREEKHSDNHDIINRATPCSNSAIRENNSSM